MNPLHLAFVFVMGAACLATFVTSETLHTDAAPSAQMVAHWDGAGSHRTLR
ncbi:hypothetical protein ACJ5NV_14065 [Loktanella agnita]|uniref:hypothetical protein n=1 Tax=Loktanella agnita TaxID=287097 RepID=UPI0039871C32